MKSFIQALIFFIILTVISVNVCHAQSYSLASDGKSLVKAPKATTTATKSEDKVFATQDGIVFYQGAKGGVYYWKVSSKTGKKYKCYVKASK